MPFSAAWKPLPDVGASGRQGSDIASCPNAKINRSIRSRQPIRRTTRHTILCEIRRCHVSRISEETASAPSMEPAYCRDSRQCPLSPCHIAETIFFRKAPSSVSYFPSAVQSGTKPGGKSLEAGENTMYSQSIFSTAQRLDRSRNATIGVMESTQQHSVPIMRHYLRRSV